MHSTGAEREREIERVREGGTADHLLGGTALFCDATKREEDKLGLKLNPSKKSVFYI